MPWHLLQSVLCMVAAMLEVGGGKLRNLPCDWSAGRGIGWNATSQKSESLMGVGGNSVATFQEAAGAERKAAMQPKRHFNCPLPTRGADTPCSHSAWLAPPYCLARTTLGRDRNGLCCFEAAKLELEAVLDASLVNDVPGL